jgi:hypothetical protein
LGNNCEWESKPASRERLRRDIVFNDVQYDDKYKQPSTSNTSNSFIWEMFLLGVLFVYAQKVEDSLQSMSNAQVTSVSAAVAQLWLPSAHVAPGAGVGAHPSVVCPRGLGRGAGAHPAVVCPRRNIRPCRSPRDSSIAAGAIRRFASTTSSSLSYARSAATSEWRPAGAHVAC